MNLPWGGPSFTSDSARGLYSTGTNINQNWRSDRRSFGDVPKVLWDSPRLHHAELAQIMDE